MNRQQGYTLIEILLTAAVLGVLLAIGAGSYGSYQRSAQLAESVQNTVNLIRNVQEKSLTDTTSYKISYVPATKVLQWKNSSNTVLQTLALPYGDASSWPEDIVFLSRGLPFKQYQVTLRNTDKQRSIYVLTTGKVIVR